jgi:hypothetical protein
MTHSPDFPPSPAYLARQDERQKILDNACEQQKCTDRQILDARDETYVAEKRNFFSRVIMNVKQDMDNDSDIEGYVHKYHTDVG